MSGADLLPGQRCGGCRSFKTCKAMFGHTENDTYCDWSPSRFRERAELPPEEAKPTIHDRRQLDLVAAIDATKKGKP